MTVRPLSPPASASQQERMPHRPHSPPIRSVQITAGQKSPPTSAPYLLGREKAAHLISTHRGGGKSSHQAPRFCLLVHRRRGWSAQQPRRKSPAVSIGIRRHSCKFSSKARQGPARQHQWKIERYRAVADVPRRTANNRRHLLLHLAGKMLRRRRGRAAARRHHIMLVKWYRGVSRVSRVSPVNFRNLKNGIGTRETSFAMPILRLQQAQRKMANTSDTYSLCVYTVPPAFD